MMHCYVPICIENVYPVGGGGDYHMKVTGMFVGKLELNP